MEIAQQTDILELTLHSEKIQGKGEDATPTLLKIGNYVLLSVYDGMGGAGSAIYEKEGNKTGAAIAAELAKKVNEELFSTLTVSEGFSLTDYPRQLEKKLKEVFKEEISRLDTKTSRLKSSLIKRLPTTLAGIITDISDNRNIKLVSFWAGDSRNFILENSDGFKLLSKDHITSKGDSSTIDAPLSNCINADTDFYIRQIERNTNGQVILLCATDGCFGYFSSLPHFEHSLLNYLQLSDGKIENWQKSLKEEISHITQDDFSMSLIMLGSDSFYDFTKNQLFITRINNLNWLLRSFNDLEERIKRKDKELADMKKQREVEYNKVWVEYKKNYESIISEQ